MAKRLSNRDSFFSIGVGLILLDAPLPYDLYINSSGNAFKDKFVRIFPTGEVLEADDVVRFKKKYHQLYILENQREDYLRSLAKSDNITPEEKATIIKDSAVKYLDKLFDKDTPFTTELLEETIESSREAVDAMVDVIQDYNVNEVQALIGDLSFHDFYTYDHSINVSMYTITIYKALKPNASREALIQAGLSGLLHDLGKIRIPTEIINNPGKLSDEEFALIKKHPEMGRDLLQEHHQKCACHSMDLPMVMRVVVEHHENVDGRGYPAGKKSDEIHLVSKIVSIADFFDAITTKRSYHEVLTTEEALGVMSRAVGKKLDSEIFQAFVENAERIVQKRFIQKELDDDFDPCQPTNVLPLRPVKPTVIDSDFTGIRKVDLDKIKKAK